MIKTIIWDWNGTLLDDLELSLNCVNILLKDRGLPILSVDKYKEIFTFPVIDYYKAAGFDFEKEAFEVPAKQYVRKYRECENSLRLFSDAVEVIDHLKEKGFKQIILSAMKDTSLKEMVNNAGIFHYFDGVYGIKDNYAREKVSLGKQIVTDMHLDVSECLMIGDTLHDAEVAEHCGFNCLLYSGGHVSKQRLSNKPFKIIDKLSDIKSIDF